MYLRDPEPAGQRRLAVRRRVGLAADSGPAATLDLEAKPQALLSFRRPPCCEHQYALYEVTMVANASRKDERNFAATNSLGRALAFRSFPSMASGS